MDRKIRFGDKEFIINNNLIRIGKEFQATPAEIPKISEILGLAGSMSSLNVLPPEIKNPPFTVEFMEDGNHKLIRESDESFITFSFEDVDSVVKYFQMALAVALDLQKISPQTIAAHSSGQFADVFEGRD